MPHAVGLVNGKNKCSRCGTERDKRVQLSDQECPVWVLSRADAEVQEGTAVYAAWHRCVRAMRAARGVQSEVGEGRPEVAPAAAAAPVALGDGLEPPRAQPGIQLRAFRSHALVKAGACEFCMLCFTKAPRYRVAEWRSTCCDGAAPVGGCPKHMLMAAVTAGVAWPARYAERGTEIAAAGAAWRDSKAGLALQPPRRRRLTGGGPAGF